jgi:thiol-disulfide isomerase/thioredoxin
MKKIDQKIFSCPNCKAESLLFEDCQILCLECKNKFEYKNNKIIFLQLNKTDVIDILDKIKFRLKKFSFLYDLLIKLISPVCPTINF